MSAQLLAEELERSIADAKANPTNELGAVFLPIEFSERLLKALRAQGEPVQKITEAMWGGLARDIIFWHDITHKRTPASLFELLDNFGREIPQWLRDEPELKDLNHAISKGTRAVIIYKAMQYARLPAPPTERA